MDFDIFCASLQCLLDSDGDGQVALSELREGLDQNGRIESKVRSGKDDTAVMSRLAEYMEDNGQVLRSIFQELDVKNVGHLDQLGMNELIQVCGCHMLNFKF